MQDLQASTEAGGLEMQLAQAAAAVHLVVNEQRLPIETAADHLQVGIDRQRLQATQSFSPGADALRQGVDQGVNAGGAGGGLGHGGPKRFRMAILTRVDAAPDGWR